MIISKKEFVANIENFERNKEKDMKMEQINKSINEYIDNRLNRIDIDSTDYEKVRAILGIQEFIYRLDLRKEDESSIQMLLKEESCFKKKKILEILIYEIQLREEKRTYNYLD